ncbi:MAG: hypothetical protein Q7U99_24985 [Rubrivivax sp.]|nr:hypothetical protein [Rubrivivax sp.]
MQTALEFMSRHATTTVVAITPGLAAWLGWKLWQRRRFGQLAALSLTSRRRSCRRPWIRAHRPLLLDFRGRAMVAETGPITDARQADLDSVARAVGDWPKHHDIVTLCACPEDATAVRAARSLTMLGYTLVRPLAGGYDAWVRYLAPRSDR